MRRTVGLLLAFAVFLVSGVALLATAVALPSRSAAPDPVAVEVGKAVVGRFYAAVNDALRTGTPPNLDGLVAPELLRAADGLSNAAGVEFHQALDRLGTAFAGLQLTVETLVVDGGQAVALVTVEGGRRDILPGLSIHGPTGWHAVDRFRLGDGRIVAFDHREQNLEAASSRPLFDAPLDRPPAAPAVIEVNRVTLPPGAQLSGLVGPGTEVLVLEAGVLTVQLSGPASRHSATSGPTTVEGEVSLRPADVLVVPTGTPFAVANGGQTPAVILGVALFPTAERGPENEGIDASALSRAALAEHIPVQRLAAGLVTDLAAGPATLVATGLTLAPGAGIARHEVAGAELLAVETGTLDLTVYAGEGQLMRTGGAESLTAPATSMPGGGALGRDGFLAAGEDAFLPGGTGYALRNTGAGPLRLIVVRIVPAATAGG